MCAGTGGMVSIPESSNRAAVPFGQSQEMADALARLGKPASLIRLAGEDHWLSRGKTCIEVLEDTESFLRKYLQ